MLSLDSHTNLSPIPPIIAFHLKRSTLDLVDVSSSYFTASIAAYTLKTTVTSGRRVDERGAGLGHPAGRPRAVLRHAVVHGLARDGHVSRPAGVEEDGPRVRVIGNHRNAGDMRLLANLLLLSLSPLWQQDNRRLSDE